jgi:hypothetical protein
MDYKPDFLIIPGVIAFDEDITTKGGLLYAVIYWMSKLSGQRCIASNVTLAETMGRGTTPDYVKKLLTSLEKKGYIERVYKAGRVDGELIREEIVPLVNYGGVMKPPTGGVETSTSGGVETSTDISKTIISKSNKEYIQLSQTLGKTPLSRLGKFYALLYRDEFQVDPKVYLNGKEGGILKSLLKDYTEQQLAALLIAHFNWYGPQGQDDREHGRLKDAAYPLAWVKPNLNKYIIFLNSIHRLDLEDSRDVADFVKDYVCGLSTGEALDS